MTYVNCHTSFHADVAQDFRMNDMPPEVRIVGTGTAQWTDPDDHPWLVAVEFADVAGTLLPVGINLKATIPAGPETVHHLGGQVSTTVLRSMKIPEVIELCRKDLLSLPGALEAIRARFSVPPAVLDAVRARARHLADMPAPGQATGRPPTWTDDEVIEIAGLYRSALAAGARSPWSEVSDELERRGQGRLTPGQITNIRRRAIRLGVLIPGDGNERWGRKGKNG
jgi:hypothetical protein